MKCVKSLIAGALCTTTLLATAFATDISQIAALPETKKDYQPGVSSAYYDKSFIDVQPSNWYYDAVMTLTDGGLLSGYDNGKYGPNDQLTREQIHLIAIRLSTLNFEGNTLAVYNGFDRAEKVGADRAFALIVLMDKANYDYVMLSDHTDKDPRYAYLNEVQVSTFSDLTGPGWEGFANVYGVRHTKTENGYYYSTDKYGNTEVRQALSNHSAEGTYISIYRPVYDTWYANIKAGKQIDYIKSIDDLPDAAEIYRWIDENAELMRNHLVMGDTIDYIKEYCANLIVCGYNIGLFGGMDSSGIFAPYAPITRSQIAQALFNTGWTFKGALDFRLADGVFTMYNTNTRKYEPVDYKFIDGRFCLYNDITDQYEYYNKSVHPDSYK